MKRTISHYFAPSQKRVHTDPPTNEAVLIAHRTLPEPVTLPEPTPLPEPATTDTPSALNVLSNDVGLFINKRRETSVEQTLHLLNNAFVPGDNFDWPYKTRLSRGKREKRYLNKEHFVRCKTLTYSRSKKGVFCRNCALFAPDCAGLSKGQRLGRLVNEPLTSYDRMFGKDGYLDTHLQTNYHAESTLKAQDFIKRHTDPSRNISNLIDSNRLKNIEENRERLAPIIKTVIFCGRNGLPLRGHRDTGDFDLSRESGGDGNFRELLRFRAESGDAAIEKIVNAPKNARYLHYTTQNEVIDICGEIIISDILKDVEESRFFSILADETTDVSKQEQMNVCVRPGLRRGECGEFRGVQAEMRKDFPQASYVHCSSHCLNLSLSKSSDVQGIRNCVGTISEVTTFINASAKRLKTFTDSTSVRTDTGKRERLVKLCETRWVERHESVTRFYDFYAEIEQVLGEITKWRDATASSKASSLLTAIEKHDFVFSLIALNHILAVTKPLAVSLQKVDKDLMQCVFEINNSIEVLKEKRKNCDAIAEDFATKAEQMLGEPLTKPRISTKQRHRENVEAANPTEYYKRSILIPFMDGLITDMTDRFAKHNSTVLSISALIPSHLTEYNFSDIVDVVQFYQLSCPYSEESVRAEYDRWRMRWSTREDLPSCPAQSLKQCDRDLYPAIHDYLKIYCCIPATTATAERTFSTLKYLKSYLRSTMGESRLNGLTHLYLRKDITVDVKAVMDAFSKKKRRVQFVI